jgi:hypothetical protein
MTLPLVGPLLDNNKFLFLFLFRKAPPSVVSGYGKRSINLNKVVANFEKHINDVAPVTNLCLGRATMRSHSSQWSKKKVAAET